MLSALSVKCSHGRIEWSIINNTSLQDLDIGITMYKICYCNAVCNNQDISFCSYITIQAKPNNSPHPNKNSSWVDMSACLPVVCLSVWCPLPVKFILRPPIGPEITWSVSGLSLVNPIGRINQVTADWQDQPGSSRLAGSTRLQPIGRIKQIAVDWQYQPGSSRLAESTRYQAIGRINKVASWKAYRPVMLSVYGIFMSNNWY